MTEAARQPNNNSNLTCSLMVMFVSLLCLGGSVLWLFSWLNKPTWAAAAMAEEQLDLLLLGTPPSEAFCRQADPPLVCAHGGDATVAAPNTLAAMNAALEAGAQCIEVDVALTKDGSVVCLHMRQLTQWTDQSLLQVGDLTLAEVLDLQGPQNETVPLLEDVIRLLHHGVTRLIIDIKLHELDGQLQDEEAAATAVSNLVEQYRCTSCLLWCSKSDAVVMQLAASGIPPSQLGYIVLPAGGSSSIKTDPFRLQDAQVIGTHYTVVDESFVSEARRRGKHVYAWTANTPAMMESALRAGPDAIVTDYFQTLQHIMDSWTGQCLAIEL